ncbi:NADH:flavin oxidoreductase [Microbacterium saccharophilum]|uniref:NADH:flavin oxidoreductase n=1 Tax=Microbacterium saccharophilum TaxID=1213358 RepID=A0A5C8I8M8_9MICO|nr:NADH:flavin oxidoreductase [Microbacterium saccharophilum]TXK14324.1 NADH:flavin oxidoreductase [Microbacterium saccharophilum]GEP49019.1 NADH:flavin oxidoreductase [Microbacterium saccharophilum]
MTSHTPDPLALARLGPVTLRNRVIKSATFEGVTPDALVSDRLIDFHVRVGEGGAGMTTVAYLAVAPEGRTERGQVYWRPEALPGLRRLTDAVHATGAKVSAQIGHAGPVANSRSTGLPSLAPSMRPNALAMGVDRKASVDDIRRIVRQHAEATRYAIDVGFDAVEVHVGHNYLASSFLSPNINRRKDEWGGSLQNRARFPRMILEAVREAADGQIAVLAKTNMADGVAGGLWLDESLAFARMVEADGHLDALELTGGSSLLNPMYLFRGDIPLAEMAATQKPIIRLGMKMFGWAVFQKYPYEPMYFLDYARQFREALSMPLVLLGGITDLVAMQAAMRDGFEYVAMARALLREPDLINRIGRDAAARSACIHCNLCAESIFTGTRCPLAAGAERVSR